MSFFTGFVTGLAKSVDTQLKSSIERTRDNIDMISKFRLKKAEERQKEKMKKSRELEELIKDGAYAISGDATNIEAQNTAAALYKEQGRTGFLETVALMKTAGSGINVQDYINRVETSSPPNTYTLSEIVGSIADAESTYLPIDATIPDELIRGGGLIKAISGPDFSITAKADERVRATMGAAGVSLEQQAALELPRISFDKFNYKLANLPFDERVKFLQEEMSRTTNTPERNQELSTIFNQQLQAREASGLLENEIQAKKIRLNRMTPGSDAAVKLSNEIINLELNFEIQTAADPSAKLTKEAQQAYRNGDMDAFRTKMEEATFVKTGLNEKIDTTILKLQTKLSQLDPQTQEYKDTEAEIVRLSSILEVGKNKDVDDTSLRGAISILDGEIDREVAANLELLAGSEYIKLAKLVKASDNPQAIVDAFDDNQKEIYDKGQLLRTQLELDVFNRMIPHTKKELRAAFDTLGRMRGYTTVAENVSAGSSSSEEQVNNLSEVTKEIDGGQTEDAIPTIEPKEVKAITAEDIATARNQFPDNRSGGEDAAFAAIDDGDTLEQALEEAESLQYGEEFKKEIRRVYEEERGRKATEFKESEFPQPLEGAGFETVDVPTPSPRPDAVITRLGKTTAYKQIGDDYYRIKPDGTLAKDPEFAPLVLANLRNPDSPLVTRYPVEPKETNADPFDLPVDKTPSEDRRKGLFPDDIPELNISDVSNRVEELAKEGVSYRETVESVMGEFNIRDEKLASNLVTKALQRNPEVSLPSLGLKQIIRMAAGETVGPLTREQAAAELDRRLEQSTDGSVQIEAARILDELEKSMKGDS